MGKYDDLDAFWDLGKIMPKKKKLTPFSTTINPVEHKIVGDESKKTDDTNLTVSLMHKDNEILEEQSYEPEYDSLIKKVTTIRSADKYDFYGNFRKAAIVYYDYKTEKCAFAPYYSYMPQYSQLTIPQKQYYFYWRDMVRRGKYIQSDYSYLYLYVYEILNLPDVLSPKEGVKLLCKLWSEYREALPKIDANFAVWVQDYCLVHRIPCPMEYISEFIFDVISASSFKEFYLPKAGCFSEAETDAMIAYMSDYDFRRCKFRTAENKKTYNRYMLGAMSRVIEKVMINESSMYDKSKTAEIIRDAFPRSLCTHAVKCRLKIEYTPLLQDSRIRAIVTMAVRYTENKLRAQLGIKSRLAIKDFPDEYRRVIDRYFDLLIYDKSRAAAKSNIPEYESLYDAPKEAMSIDGADQIERASWATTAMLVSEEESESFVYETIDRSQEAVAAIECSASEAQKSNVDDYGLKDEEILLISEILLGRVKRFDLSLEEKTEKINEIFAENLGDVIIEQGEEGYKIIDDYIEEVETWLTKIKK